MNGIAFFPVDHSGLWRMQFDLAQNIRIKVGVGGKFIFCKAWF